MSSCSCGGDMVPYGDGLLVCTHEDLGHRLGTCPSCHVYQSVTNNRTRR